MSTAASEESQAPPLLYWIARVRRVYAPEGSYASNQVEGSTLATAIEVLDPGQPRHPLVERLGLTHPPAAGMSMKAYKLLEEAARNPVSQLVVFAAFDAAWSEIKNQYPDQGPERDGARHRLASAMLPYVSEEAADPLWLKESALRAIGALT